MNKEKKTKIFQTFSLLTVIFGSLLVLFNFFLLKNSRMLYESKPLDLTLKNVISISFLVISVLYALSLLIYGTDKNKSRGDKFKINKLIKLISSNISFVAAMLLFIFVCFEISNFKSISNVNLYIIIFAIATILTTCIVVFVALADFMDKSIKEIFKAKK